MKMIYDVVGKLLRNTKRFREYHGENEDECQSSEDRGGNEIRPFGLLYSTRTEPWQMVHLEKTVHSPHRCGPAKQKNTKVDIDLR